EIAHAAQENGYLAYSISTDQWGNDSEAVLNIARKLVARQVDGLIIYRSMPVDVEVRRALGSLSVPVVFVGKWVPTISNRWVELDFESGIKEAAEHLAALGHKRAVHFTSSGQFDFPEHKLWPYQRHLKKVGINLLQDKDWQIESNS